MQERLFPLVLLAMLSFAIGLIKRALGSGCLGPVAQFDDSFCHGFQPGRVQVDDAKPKFSESFVELFDSTSGGDSESPEAAA